MREVSLRQLRALRAIDATGKIVRAASILGVTPPAVTLQMKQLEEALGLALFERHREGLRPTDAGRALIDAAHRIEAVLEECSAQLDAIRGIASGRVSVGVVSTAKYFAPRALAEFARLHPKVELNLVVANREKTLRSLAALEIDIAITGYPPDDLDLERASIGDHPHVVIAAVDHRLVARKRLTFAALAEEVFVVRERGSGTRALMERLFAAANIAPRHAMEIDSNETIKQAVMAGLGLAFISGHTIAAEVEDGRLAILPVQGLPEVRQWYAVRHRAKRPMPAGQAMWAWLVSESGRFLPQPSKTAAARR